MKKAWKPDTYYDVGKAPVMRVVSEDRVQLHKKPAVRGATKRKAGQLLVRHDSPSARSNKDIDVRPLGEPQRGPHC